MGTAICSTVSASVRASVKGSMLTASVRASVKVIVHEDLRHLHRRCKGLLVASNALRGGDLGRGDGLEADGLGEGILGGIHLCRHSSTLCFLYQTAGSLTAGSLSSAESIAAQALRT